MWTVLRNRIGDAVLLGVFCLQFNWNVTQNLNWVLPLIMIASSTKGALAPFSTWLTKAIAAPTPVSALVHRSTLVVAGPMLILYLIPNITGAHFKNLTYLTIISIVFRGLLALKEQDLKKLIALRTLRQVRLGVLLSSQGGAFFGLYHLTAHALYKSLIFISVGNIIHNYWGEQEQRNSASSVTKTTLVVLNISLISLRGLFYGGGRVIKELILETSSNPTRTLLIYLGLVLITYFTLRYRNKISKGAKSSKPLIHNKRSVIIILRLVGLRIFRVLFLNWTRQNLLYSSPNLSEETYVWLILTIILLTKNTFSANKIKTFDFYIISRTGHQMKTRLNNLGIYTEQTINFLLLNRLRSLKFIRIKVIKIFLNYRAIFILVLILRQRL